MITFNLNVNIEIKIYLSYWTGVNNEQMIDIFSTSHKGKVRFFEGTFHILNNNICWKEQDVRFFENGPNIPFEIRNFCDKMIKLRLFE